MGITHTNNQSGIEGACLMVLRWGLENPSNELSDSWISIVLSHKKAGPFLTLPPNAFLCYNRLPYVNLSYVDFPRSAS
jgi:hypothetical protein